MVLIKKVIYNTNLNYNNQTLVNLKWNSSFVDYVYMKQSILQNSFSIFAEKNIIDLLISTDPTYLFKTQNSKQKHVAFYPNDYYSNNVDIHKYLVYYTSLGPKTVDYDSVGIVPGIITKNTVLNERSKPSNLVWKYIEDGSIVNANSQKDGIFTYPFRYRLSNNFYHNPYVQTLDNRNTLLFDVNKIQNADNNNILQYLNPLNPKHNAHEITNLNLYDLLLYETVLDVQFLTNYARIRKNTTDIEALHEAIKLITEILK